MTLWRSYAVWTPLACGWVVALAFAVAMCDRHPAVAHGPGAPTGLSLVSTEPPDEWCAFCLEVQHDPGGTGRPETKTGEHVYVLRVKDADREIVIPWPYGMTVTEALLAWKRSP